MPPRTGADNIGTLSVDVIADLAKFDSALSQVEERLGKANKDVTIKLSIPEAQLTRLKTAAQLIERIQKAGVPDLSGLSGAATTAKVGRGGAVSGGKANVNVSFKEEDLTATFRKAAVAAFAQPIPGVKLDLDMTHLQEQLRGLHISFTGANATQAAPSPTTAGPRPVPAGIREEIKSDKVKGAIDDMFTAVNVALKRSNQPMLQASTDVASKFTALADALGDSMHKVVQLGEAQGPYGRPVTGGSINNMLSGAADDVADKLEEAGRTFYERVGKTGLFQAYRSAGGQPAPAQGAAARQAYAPTGAQQQQVQLAQMRAAEESIAVSRRQAQNMPEGTRSGLPRSIDDINNFARQLAKTQGYESGRPGRSTVERERGQTRRNVAPLQGPTVTGLPVELGGQAPNREARPWEEIQREFVAGRRSHGPRGMTAFGRVATSQGTDITDLLMAAGPGARGLSGFGEVMSGGRGSGQYVSLTPEEQERLKGAARQQDTAAGHPLVQAVRPAEMLRRVLMASRGASGEEAKQIAQWAMRSGGPLASRDLGAQLGSSTGDMANLSSLMSAGGSTIANEARDALRLRRLQNERRDLQAALAGTGVPSEQRHLRSQIANRSGQISRLALINAGGNVTGAQNRQMIEEGALDPLTQRAGPSRSGGPLPVTRQVDRPALITALANAGQFGQEQGAFQQQIEETRRALLGGFLPMGEGTQVGGMSGGWTQGQALFGEVKKIVNEFRESVGLKPTRRESLKSMTGQLEREGFPTESAAISMLFGEKSSRAAFAEQAISSYPQRTGLTEAGMTPGGRHKGDIGIKISPEEAAARAEYDKLARQYEKAYGREGSAAHDPLAVGKAPATIRRYPVDENNVRLAGPPETTPLPGSPGGSFEQRRQIGEGQLLGAHPTRLQPITGEMNKIALRVREQVGRSMGVRFGEEGKPVLPASGNVSEADFESAVQAALTDNPKYQELIEAQPKMAARLTELRRTIAQAPRGAYIRTGAPPVMTGDEMRMRYYESSGMAPMGGVPLSAADIRKRLYGPTPGSPAITVPGAASQMGPSIVPPAGGGRGAETAQGGPGSPMGGGVVKVWIDGPFPLNVNVQGGSVGLTEEGSAAAGGRRRGKTQAEAREMVEETTPVARAKREPKVQAGPLGPRFQLGTGATPAYEAPIVVNEQGQAKITQTPEQIAREARERRRAASVTARAARNPTQHQLLTSLAEAGYTEQELEEFSAPLPRQSRAGNVSETVFAARQAARAAQAKLPSRSLGTSIVQLSERLLGGRQQPEENIIRLQRMTGQLGRLESRGEGLRQERVASYVDVRRAREAERGFRARGEDVPEDLRNRLEAATVAYKRNTEAETRNTAQITKTATRVEELGASAVKGSDILRNLGAGFIGGIGGGLVTMGVSTAVSGVIAAAGAVEEVLKPAYEAAIGYQNQTNKVIDSLSDQVRQNNGLTQSTVALKAAQSGLAFSTYKSIAPQLEQVAGIEAGNKAYQDYISLIRAGQQGPGGAPRGLYNTTGGFNLLGIQTPIGGTPSTLENFLNEFSGVYRSSFGGKEAGYSGSGFMSGAVPGRSTDVVQNILGEFGDLGAVLFGGETPESLVQKSETLKTQRIDEINAQLAKMGHGFDVVRSSTKDADEVAKSYTAMRQALGAAGVDQTTIDNIQSLGIVFTDASGKVLQSAGDFNAAFTDYAQSFAKIDPKTWLAGLTGASGDLTASVMALQQQSQLGRQAALGGLATSRIGAPPIRLDQILSGMTGVPGSFQGAGPGPAAPNPSLIQGYVDQGNTANQAAIAALVSPDLQAAAQQQLSILTAAGTALHDLGVEAGKIQMASMFRQMNRDLVVSNRQVSDLVGLTGKESATLNDGTKIQASDIGVLERKNMLLSRSLQLQQFQHQTLALNYQIALAGFTAEGATGEERAARLEIAQKESQFQKEQLAGQKELANTNWQLQQKENDRAFTDAMYQSNELVKRLDDTGALQRIDDKIAQWTEVRDAAADQYNSYIQQGNGMIQMAQGLSVELLKMGESAAAAINDATGAMTTAVGALQKGTDALANPNTTQSPSTAPGAPGSPYLGPPAPSTVPGAPGSPYLGPPAPNSGITPNDFTNFFGKAGGGAGLTDPELRATPLSRQGGVNVSIVNPSAGVDTQSLVRVVITELNRQAGLRGLTTVGGR